MTMAIYRTDYPQEGGPFGSAFGTGSQASRDAQREAARNIENQPSAEFDMMENPVSRGLLGISDSIFGPWRERFWGVGPQGPFRDVSWMQWAKDSPTASGGSAQLGSSGAGKRVGSLERGAYNSIRNVPNIATREDYEAYLRSDDTEEYYIGGLPRDAVSKRETERFQQSGQDPAGRPVRQGRQVIDQYGRPVYRKGDEVKFGTRLGSDKIREWQAFFQLLGFKTGPSGAWTAHEIGAMEAFMMYANGTPGGGMTVDTLRDRVKSDIQNGMDPRELNLPALLGEEDTFGEDTGAGTGEELGEPYTMTTTERQVTEFSMDEAMASIRQVLAESIGRAPTEEEARRFMSDINSAFRDDPTVIETVTTVDPVTGEEDTERTVSESGVAPEEAARQFGREDVPEEELREHQAGRYFDVIMQELGI